MFLCSLMLQYVAVPAFAVHEEGLFELDGNVENDAAAGDDWNAVFNGNDDAIETRRRGSFDPFWNTNHGNTPDEQAVYDLMVKRPYTYFIKDQGINYAWVSLLAAEVRNAEALYWFSDFRDGVDDEQLKAVLENLKRRRQKLFIHASEMGDSFEEVRDKLAVPSGGSVILTRP